MNGIRRFNPTQLFNDGLLGQYSTSAATGELAAGTTGELFQWRWADDLRLCVVRRVIISMAKGVTAFAASPLSLQVAKATAWTVQGTGGTAIDIQTTATGKRRNLMPTSLLVAGDARIATTTGLGGGTKTIDNRGPRNLIIDPTATPILPPTDIMSWDVAANDYPLVLSQNEGFLIRCQVNPGTGTFQFAVSVDWAECNAS